MPAKLRASSHDKLVVVDEELKHNSITQNAHLDGILKFTAEDWSR